MSGGVFVLHDDGELKPMKSAPFSSEDDFQALLASHPDLLVGDQISPSDPRRWLLIKREVGVPGEEGHGDRWSLDHLLVDQDAIPTLVEVKRSSDTRLRREVVGQMLDYAANAVVHWPAERVKAHFEARCEEMGVDPESELARLLDDDDADLDSFWHRFKTNLQAGQIRLVFLADSIPSELRRVVEFLNGQMDPAEVLAIEIKQYVGEDVTALVSRVLGETETARQKRAGTANERRKWDEESFFMEFEARNGTTESRVARNLMEWAQRRGLEIFWGKGGQDGSLKPILHYGDFRHFLFSVWTSGRIGVQFKRLSGRAPFRDESKRRELQRRLNEIPGVAIPDEGLTKRPSIPISILTDESALDAFLSAMDWAAQEIRSS